MPARERHIVSTPALAANRKSVFQKEKERLRFPVRNAEQNLSKEANWFFEL